MTKYILGFYEVDRAYGGPEEGGWWYDTAKLVRPLSVITGADRAFDLAHRANRLLDRLQRHKRDTGSMAYDGGRHRVIVHPDRLPDYFPEETPHYE